MFEEMKRLFGIGPKVDFKELVENGAILIDVRSIPEYKSGSIKGAMNIPHEIIGNNLSHLKDKNQAIILFCKSGVRSSMAKAILKKHGYTNLYNGGSINSLSAQLN